MTASHGYNSEYVPPTPLPAQGGIAARSRDGAIGESWGSERFIDLLESFGARFAARARTRLRSRRTGDGA